MRQIVVEYGQSLMDIAIQEFGSLDYLSTICDLNNLEFDADLQAGQVLILPEADPENDIQQYYADEGIRVNSHFIPEDLQVLATNDDEAIAGDSLIGV